MYVYGCSLGGTVISHLLINDKDHKFSGAVGYGNPFDITSDIETFKNRMWGFYDILLGLAMNMKIRKVYPELKKYSSKE